MGRLRDGGVVFASESCALDAIGARFERDILPGEIVVADKSGVKSDTRHCGKAPKRLCVFEFIYFARPDSVIDGSSVHVARQRAGAFLALEHPVQADIVIAPRTENGILVTLEGQKLGALIGRRGETLDAIQQLTNYSVNRGRAHRVRVHIDAENYRAKREESLRRLAKKVAMKVVKYRRNITLEPMNAYERHVIHETLQDTPDVITYSTGTEPNRRTVVAYSRGKHAY